MAATERGHLRPLARAVRSALASRLAHIARRTAPATTQSAPRRDSPAALAALTLAALALPGVCSAFETRDALFQYSRYEEDGRSFWPGPDDSVDAKEPLRVDSERVAMGLALTGRLSLDANYVQDTWSGATPLTTAPQGLMNIVTGASTYYPDNTVTAFVDQALVPYGYDPNALVPRPGIVHMMTSASAETRRQLDLTLGYEWDRASIEIGGGASDEPDFQSRFVNLDGTMDFNDKRTTLNAGGSYTHSAISAHLGLGTIPPARAFTDYGLYLDSPAATRIVSIEHDSIPELFFRGSRDEWSAHLGLTQVLDRKSTLSLGVGYSRSRGSLENPYKLVVMGFAAPPPANPGAPPPLPVLTGLTLPQRLAATRAYTLALAAYNRALAEYNRFATTGMLLTTVFNLPESRPDRRGQWTLNADYSRYFSTPNAALNVQYRWSADDWGIDAHALELQWRQGIGRGWVVTPRVRYYTQTHADFYRAYYMFLEQAPVTLDAFGIPHLDFARIGPRHYSSDQRLSAYGAASAGISISRRFARGVSLEAGIERYIHAGSLAPGGGEGGFADFNYWSFDVGLRIEPGSRAGDDTGAFAAHAGHGGHDRHGSHPGALVPAGVDGAHMMPAGTMMAGYRFGWTAQSGPVLRGTAEPGDFDIAVRGCTPANSGCITAPVDMTMSMHMLELMYAPTDRVNLMVMLHAMDMDMNMRPLNGIGIDPASPPHTHHDTGGVGDTTVAALVKLFETTHHEMHLGLGISIPTGAVDLEMSHAGAHSHGGDLLMDYGMQLGSGTWDVLPSATYNGRAGRLWWGAQIEAARRTGGPNESGYTLGDRFGASAWAGWSPADWISGSVRGVYTAEGAPAGLVNDLDLLTAMGPGPQDLPQNYGGRAWDVGFGLSLALPGRRHSGDRIGVEWLQPVSQHVRGYQLRRDGSLSVNLQMTF